MGRHQQAEASGIISFMACATLAWIAMDLYLQFAPAIWRVTQRLFTVCAGITAGCGVISFTLGYARNSRSMTLKHGWTIPIRRIFEILALSVVYASTIFVTAFMLLSIDGVAHVKRLSDCALRRDLGGRRLCHVRTGGTHECQDHRILVAVLRGFRCQHRRIDVR